MKLFQVSPVLENYAIKAQTEPTKQLEYGSNNHPAYEFLSLNGVASAFVETETGYNFLYQQKRLNHVNLRFGLNKYLSRE